jgi:acetyltransferase-like isoleucine patch superfamily enzyme
MPQFELMTPADRLQALDSVHHRRHIDEVSNPFHPGYFLTDELRCMGFARVGEGCAIARNCTIVGLENITLGDFVRIDGYTTIVADQGSVEIGSRVHICSGSVVGARGGVRIGDYSSLSHSVRILSAVDDFSGEAMTNSTLPAKALRVHQSPVVIERYVPIGTGTLILPGVTIGEGAAVEALSLVSQNLPSWVICGGNPAKPLRARKRDLLGKESLIKNSD